MVKAKEEMPRGAVEVIRQRRPGCRLGVRMTFPKRFGGEEGAKAEPFWDRNWGLSDQEQGRG